MPQLKVRRTLLQEHTVNNLMSGSFLPLQLFPVGAQTCSGHVETTLAQNSVQISAPLNWIIETQQTWVRSSFRPFSGPENSMLAIWVELLYNLYIVSVFVSADTKRPRNAHVQRVRTTTESKNISLSGRYIGYTHVRARTHTRWHGQTAS